MGTELYTEIVKASPDFIKAVAWPAIAGYALKKYRWPLAQLMRNIGQRATKVSLFHVSVELATVREFSLDWSFPMLSDVRQASPSSEFDSGSLALFQQFEKPTPSDYAVIDLGTGGHWLTSRLFIFAIMLRRMCGLRCFVFVAKSGNISRCFLGTASPDAVRWALACRYPWLEQAFAAAYAQAAPLEMVSMVGGLNIFAAQQLVRNFLENPFLQSPSPPLPPNEGEWVLRTSSQGLPTPPSWEHGHWTDETSLEKDLAAVLETGWVYDSPDVNSTLRARRILRRKNCSFVALVDQQGKFQRLVDRQVLLEQAGAHLAWNTSRNRTIVKSDDAKEQDEKEEPEEDQEEEVPDKN